MEESIFFSIEHERGIAKDIPLSAKHLMYKSKNNDKFNDSEFPVKFELSLNQQKNTEDFETNKYKNIIVKSKKAGTATKAILTGHGGYTPRRYRIFPGSGNVELPENMSVHFFSKDGEPTLRKTLQNILDGDIHKIETAKGRSKIRDYSLTNDRFTDHVSPTDDYDIISISGNSKVHFSDVINSIKNKNHKYTDIYYTCCRVNKLKPIIITHE